jgi:hypothetical protein
VTEIDVQEIGSGVVLVTVTEGATMTSHRVSVTRRDAERLAPGASVPELVRESFRFLLEREPKEAILGTFDLPVIGRYFPEYETEMAARLTRDR